jgi:signal transduction histidine kinase
MTKPLNTFSNISYTKSSSFKMALLFTLLCGLSLSILGYFSYFFERGHFIHGTEEIINTEIKHLGMDQLLHTDDSGRLFIPFGPHGEPPVILGGKVERLKEGIIVFVHPSKEKTYAAKIHTFENNRKILVGIDITQTQSEFHFMKWLSIISIALIILVVLVSYMISVFVAKGTNRIATTAQNIMDTGDLSKRLEVSSPWDDLGKMSTTLNLMLARIEELMGGVRQVSDNIAHDLRTPLTRLRNHIEAAQHDSSKTSKAALLNEADQLLNTFNALLRISRLEAEKKRERFHLVALKPLIEDVIALYEPLAEEKHIALQQQLINADCDGDKDLLFQAYANVIDNAIKYTPEDGKISITMYRENEFTVIAVEDSGEGIAEQDIRKVFQRFYRCDVSRANAGNGLGLSLVQAVFDLHHGQLDLENTASGLRFITKL